MGNSVAYPVLRTTDAAEAYAQAVRLCGLLEERDDEVVLHAELFTVEDVRRMAAVLPDGPFDYLESRRDPATGDFADYVDKYGDLSRAERLAVSIGSTVLGAAQRGW
ncbi:hypothetical protein ACWEQJ_22570 [Streptomyces cyaneofuscatus]